MPKQFSILYVSVYILDSAFLGCVKLFYCLHLLKTPNMFNGRCDNLPHMSTFVKI